MSIRLLDPRLVNVAIDGNILNRDGSASDAQLDRLLALYAAGTVRLVVPKGVRIEINDPHTPAKKRRTVQSALFTLPVSLNSDERARHRAITAAFKGNARSDRHKADADHLFEASKYCGYFVTHDQRILKRAAGLDVLPPSLSVVTLVHFLQIFDDYVAGRCL